MLSDAEYMDRALFMAARGRGRTTPNPLVGAVVVTSAGVVVGAGYHERAGEPHAEVHALRAAGAAARGATIYCTLEPCKHFGRTPPCVNAILDAGVARVVMAVEDPNARVSGGGAAILREKGVQVDEGLRREEAVALNRPFFSAMRRQRPWVIVKAATSLDGRVAAAPGVRTPLTGPEANLSSQVLRAEVDAIGVGTETLLADDPLLTVRDIYRERPLTRVVFDRRLRTPASARLLGTVPAGPVLIVTTRAAVEASPSHARRLESAGAQLIAMRDGKLDAAVRALLPFGIQSLLIEGGPTLQESAWREHLVDTVRLLVTPRHLGTDGVPWLASSRCSIPSLHDVRIEPCGSDVMIEGDVHRID